MYDCSLEWSEKLYIKLSVIELLRYYKTKVVINYIVNFAILPGTPDSKSVSKSLNMSEDE